MKTANSPPSSYRDHRYFCFNIPFVCKFVSSICEISSPWSLSASALISTRFGNRASNASKTTPMRGIFFFANFEVSLDYATTQQNLPRIRCSSTTGSKSNLKLRDRKRRLVHHVRLIFSVILPVPSSPYSASRWPVRAHFL